MIYLDNSATTRPCDAAGLAVREMLETDWFNPSALYGEAVRVEKRLEAARAAVASPLGIPPGGVVFTGSGTEADSLAILGTAARLRGRRRVLLFAVEHPAVRETAAQVEALGHAVEFFPATDEGLADLDALSAMLDTDVGLVSCMHVGNETGAVQPLAEISRLIRAKSPDALLHSDGVQGYLRLPTDMARLGVDLYTVSAHKVHGPKGVGALAVRGGARLIPRVMGGGQERGLRSGTENTAGIAAFGAAVG
ncbi:aminotransferase class V-fold PLP-dependent enzyme, partial [Eubacteriales bacterium OttesenSCG-928-A19]|nr:aminotransferase class V-fold PLP-dependent enzyme [Eubacteriales bacterium OttesenSCG-928-A19]